MQTAGTLDAETGNRTATTVPSRFAATVRRMPDEVALRARRADGSWDELSFAGYADQACRVAAGLRRLGLGRGDRAVLMLRNRPEFHVADMAVLLAGGTPVSIYNSSSAEQVRYLASQCGAVAAVVEEGFLDRFLAAPAGVPALRHIVLLDGPDATGPAATGPAATGEGGPVPWSELLQADPLDLDAAAAAVGAGDVATVIYTSGTTGAPKGVMLTHRNVCHTTDGYAGLVGVDPAGHRMLSYLPMAHIVERVFSHYLSALTGLQLSTCPDPALLGDYLTDVRPEIFFGVPRVWEKIHARVHATLAADPYRAGLLAQGVATAKPLVAAMAERPLTTDEQQVWGLLDHMAFRPLRERMGLDQVVVAGTGAAPLPKELLEWFRAVGVPLSEGYGLSETTGAMTWEPTRVRPGTVGRVFPGCEVRLLDDGEIVCRGPNVFPGYLDDPQRTAEVLDAGGWFRTGDIGTFDSDGYLSIVDRKKDLIITSGGKNISPANIEMALTASPLVAQACVIGDNRPYVTALVVLDAEVAAAWAREQGVEEPTAEDLAAHPTVRREVDRGVEEVNARLSRVEQVKRYTLLAHEWPPDSDVLTPTMKLKRRGVAARHADDIERMYQGAAPASTC